MKMKVITEDHAVARKLSEATERAWVTLWHQSPACVELGPKNWFTLVDCQGKAVQNK